MYVLPGLSVRKLTLPLNVSLTSAKCAPIIPGLKNFSREVNGGLTRNRTSWAGLTPMFRTAI